MWLRSDLDIKLFSLLHFVSHFASLCKSGTSTKGVLEELHIGDLAICNLSMNGKRTCVGLAKHLASVSEFAKHGNVLSLRKEGRDLKHFVIPNFGDCRKGIAECFRPLFFVQASIRHQLLEIGIGEAQ